MHISEITAIALAIVACCARIGASYRAILNHVAEGRFVRQHQSSAQLIISEVNAGIGGSAPWFEVANMIPGEPIQLDSCSFSIAHYGSTNATSAHFQIVTEGELLPRATAIILAGTGGVQEADAFHPWKDLLWGYRADVPLPGQQHVFGVRDYEHLNGTASSSGL